MLPVIPKPPISPQRKKMALAVASFADFLQIMLLPLLGWGYILDDAIDFFTALVLIAICGFKWQFILAFILELVPVLDILPTWTAVVLLLPTHPNPSTAPQRITAQRVHRPYREEVQGEVIVVPPVQAPPIQTHP
jgi:hypothetical protein